MSDLTIRERPYRPGRAAFDAVRELGKVVKLVDEVRFDYGPVALEADAVAKAMKVAAPYELQKVQGTELQALIDGQESEEQKRAAHQIVGQLAKPGVELARLTAASQVFLVVRFPDGALIGLRSP